MTETIKKMTKLEMFEQILTRLSEPTEIEFIKHEIELLKSKNANRKPTTAQKENEAFKEAIVGFLASNAEEKFSISEIQSHALEVKNLSNQRMSALMKQLTDSGQLNKTYEKRKAYFSYNHG